MHKVRRYPLCSYIPLNLQPNGISSSTYDNSDDTRDNRHGDRVTGSEWERGMEWKRGRVYESERGRDSCRDLFTNHPFTPHLLCSARHSHGQSISLASCIARVYIILYVLPSTPFVLQCSYQFPTDQTFNTPSDFTVYRNIIHIYTLYILCMCLYVCSAHRHKWWTTTDL